MFLFFSSLLAFALEPYEIVFNNAAAELNKGSPEGCMNVLSTQGASHLHHQKLQELAYICAVSSSNLDAANIVRKKLGPLYLPKNAMDIHHAWMLQNKGQYQQALDVLVPEGWKTERQRTVGTTMQAMVNLYLKNYKVAWFISASPYVERKAKITIANKLRDKGFAIEAKKLFEKVCPSLENPELWGCGSIIYIPK